MSTNIDRRMARLERTHADRFGQDVVFNLFGIRLDEIGAEGRDELRTAVEAELKRRGEVYGDD